MTLDFAPEVAKKPKRCLKPQVVQNSVWAYCLALLSDAVCCNISWTNGQTGNRS